MSIYFMTEAFKTNIPLTQKFIFVALCDNANDQGECYPSIPMLAKKVSAGERTVRSAIKWLKENGFLSVLPRKGSSNIYMIAPVSEWKKVIEKDNEVIHSPCTSCTPAGDAPLQEMHPTPARGAPPPLQEMHPTPARGAPRTVIEPSIEPSFNRNKRFDALAELISRNVDEQTAKDFLTLRRSKRAALTLTAIENLQREAVRAGMTLSAALGISCANGWQGFKAEWIEKRKSKNTFDEFLAEQDFIDGSVKEVSFLEAM